MKKYLKAYLRSLAFKDFKENKDLILCAYILTLIAFAEIALLAFIIHTYNNNQQ